MPVFYDGVAGYPKYKGGRDSASATNQVIIDWADINTLYNELFPPAVGTKPSLPALLFGSTVLYADSFSAEPFVGENDIPDCTGGLQEYDKAMVTIEYKTIPYEQGDGEADQIITRKWSVAGDVLILPSHGVQWKVGAVAVNDPDVRAGKIIPMIDLSVTLHRVTAAYFATLRDAVYNLIGTVNDAEFENADAETLLLLGGDFTQNVSADGTTTYQCEIKFQHRVVFDAAGNPQGWNYFYNPKSGNWEELETVAIPPAKAKPIYKLSDFTTLYS